MKLPFMCFVVVQSLSHFRLFETPWTAAHQASLSFSSPRACSNSCPSSQWCHPTISSSAVPSFAFNLSQPWAFPMGQLFTLGGQSIGASVSVQSVPPSSVSDPPMNIQDWLPLGLIGLISLPSKGLSRVFSNITVEKHQFFSAQPSLRSNFHIHTWLLEKS